MKKIIISCLFIFICVNAFAQSKFQKGYIIKNDGIKVDCLIKNEDWLNNPITIIYKLNDASESQKITVNQIREFSIGSSTKYKRFVVEIDRSSKRVSTLSKEKFPEFKEEKLFLKAIVEGTSANLYSYFDGSLSRFFFNKPNQKIKQLIYKEYKTETNKIATNKTYIKQLRENTPCFKVIKSPSYSKNSLKKYFVTYNNCNGEDDFLIDFTLKGTKGKFRVKLKGGLNYNNLVVEYPGSLFNTRTSEADYEITLRYGIEIEYLFPFNNNRWSVFIDPAYISFNGTTTNPTSSSSADNFDIDYSSIEFPLGIRYYFPMKENHKFFTNAGVAIDFASGSIRNLDIETVANIFAGIGYELKEKLSIEIRYNGNRQLLNNYLAFSAPYNGFSINFGYTLF